MNLYLDTNVIDFIAATGESQVVHEYLKSNRHTVQASETVLTEIQAIPKSDIRWQQIRALITVATSYEKKPQSWHLAQEVLWEIRRLRREWVKPVAFNKKEKQLLKLHQEEWHDARCMRLVSREAFAQYQRDAERGIRRNRQFQKVVRESRINPKAGSIFIARESNTGILPLQVDIRDREVSWRVDCLTTWHNAIAIGVQSMRDLADWLSPYIFEGVFLQAVSYNDFWLKEVKAENVPRNRLVGLVTDYQSDHKIGHGNANDQIHACNVFDVDLFLTADRAFHSILTKVIEGHFPGVRKPVFVDRQLATMLEQLQGLLSSE